MASCRPLAGAKRIPRSSSSSSSGHRSSGMCPSPSRSVPSMSTAMRRMSWCTASPSTPESRHSDVRGPRPSSTAASRCAGVSTSRRSEEPAGTSSTVQPRATWRRNDDAAERGRPRHARTSGHQRRPVALGIRNHPSLDLRRPPARTLSRSDGAQGREIGEQSGARRRLRDRRHGGHDRRVRSVALAGPGRSPLRRGRMPPARRHRSPPRPARPRRRR